MKFKWWLKKSSKRKPHSVDKGQTILKHTSAISLPSFFPQPPTTSRQGAACVSRRKTLLWPLDTPSVLLTHPNTIRIVTHSRWKKSRLLVCPYNVERFTNYREYSHDTHRLGRLPLTSSQSLRQSVSQSVSQSILYNECFFITSRSAFLLVTKCLSFIVCWDYG